MYPPSQLVVRLTWYGVMGSSTVAGGASLHTVIPDTVAASAMQPLAQGCDFGRIEIYTVVILIMF